MLKKITMFLMLILISTTSLFPKTFTKTAIYKKPDVQKPARVKASKIDETRSIVKIEEVSGSFSRIYIYAVPKNGEEFRLKQYGAGWELPLYKWLRRGNIDKYKEFVFYVNADKGGTAFREAEIKLIFKERKTVKDPLKKTLTVKNGKVTPVYFPLDNVEGANYVTLKMKSGKRAKTVIFAYNKNTGSKRTLREMEPKWDNTYLGHMIDEINRKSYTHLGVTMEKTSPSYEFKDSKGIVTIKTLTKEDLRKRDAIVERFNKTIIRLIIINLIAGLLIVKFLYPLLSNTLSSSKILLSIFGKMSPGIVLLLWAGIIYILTLTPLIPHHIHYGMRAWAFTAIPLMFSLVLPIVVDIKYNLCKKCGYYGKMDIVDMRDSSRTNQYTASDGFKKYDAGQETETTFTDYRGCPKCGNIKSASRSFITGNRKTIYKQGGRAYQKDSSSPLSHLLIYFLNPYTWYKIYKKIRIIK